MSRSCAELMFNPPVKAFKSLIGRKIKVKMECWTAAEASFSSWSPVLGRFCWSGSVSRDQFQCLCL